MDGAKRSRMPPRTAYSPVSRTADARAKPLFSSHSVRLVILTALPGAAEKDSAATFSRGGTRCRTALIVVERISGRPAARPDGGSRDRTVTRRAEIAALGETRS